MYLLIKTNMSMGQGRLNEKRIRMKILQEKAD